MTDGEITARDTVARDALAGLAAPAEPPHWPSADQIRRAGARQRRRRAVLRSATVVLAAVAIAVPVVITQTRGPSRPAPAGAASARIADTSGAAVELVARTSTPATPQHAAALAVAGSEQAFTVRLLQLLQPAGAGNVLLSPSSLSTALTMLAYGARGQTQRQLAALLGPAGSSAAQFAEGWSSLSAEWATAAAQDEITLSTANSVWLQRGAPLVPSFLTGLADYFDAGVWQADFARNPAQSAADLNAWVSRKTRGKIGHLVSADEVADLLLVLVNAAYFNATWANPFDKATITAPFTTSEGSTVQAPTMTGQFAVPALSTADLAAAQLPYRGGRFAALLIEPRATTLASYVDTLTPGTLTTLVGSLRSAQVAVQMPKLSLNATDELKPSLQALGVTDAFEPGSADLSGMSPQADYVTFVKQQATLDVDTGGTTATAATAIGVAPSAEMDVRYRLTFDHPFLFLLRDTRTGAILFSAEINNPLAH